MQLTKETDKMFCTVYQEYLNRKKSGFSKSEAKRFSAPEQLVTEFMQGTHPQDIFDCIQELRKANFVQCYVTGAFKLTDEGIIYMENRFKNGIKEVFEYLSLLK